MDVVDGQSLRYRPRLKSWLTTSDRARNHEDMPTRSLSNVGRIQSSDSSGREENAGQLGFRLGVVVGWYTLIDHLWLQAHSVENERWPSSPQSARVKCKQPVDGDVHWLDAYTLEGWSSHMVKRTRNKNTFCSIKSVSNPENRSGYRSLHRLTPT